MNTAFNEFRQRRGKKIAVCFAQSEQQNFGSRWNWDIQWKFSERSEHAGWDTNSAQFAEASCARQFETRTHPPPTLNLRFWRSVCNGTSAFSERKLPLHVNQSLLASQTAFKHCWLDQKRKNHILRCSCTILLLHSLCLGTESCQCDKLFLSMSFAQFEVSSFIWRHCEDGPHCACVIHVSVASVFQRHFRTRSMRRRWRSCSRPPRPHPPANRRKVGAAPPVHRRHTVSLDVVALDETMVDAHQQELEREKFW